MAASIASFFHKSGIRTKELKKIAAEKNLKLVRFPESFEVRWTAFSLKLLNSILISWNATTIYFKNCSEAEAKGYLNYLVDKDNLELLTFFADVLEIFSRCQNNLQKDTISLIDMMRFVNSTRDQLKDLLKEPLLKGWVSVLQKETKSSVDEKGFKIYKLKEIELNVRKRRTNTHNLHVSEKRDVGAVKNETIQAFDNFLKVRFDEKEEKKIEMLNKFSKFDMAVNLKQIHECIASDLDLANLKIEFSEIINIGLAKEMADYSIIKKIQALLKTDSYKLVTTVLARIAAAKPHSADVERLISCNNILKSAHRCSLDIKTENLYLYIYYNMPCMELWDPRPAILKWINNKDRRTKSTPKAKNQEWYHGIFEKSTIETEDKPSENKGRSF